MLYTILYCIGAFVIGMNFVYLAADEKNIKAHRNSAYCSFAMAIICLVFLIMSIKNDAPSYKEWGVMTLVFSASGILKISNLNNHKKK